MWCQAVWNEGQREIEAVVPDIWIKGGFVFWPPGIDASSALNARREPSTNWRCFLLVKVKCRYASRTACEDYDETSGLESVSEDDFPKRKAKKRMFPDFIAGTNSSPDPKTRKVIPDEDSCPSEQWTHSPSPPASQQYRFKRISSGSPDTAIVTSTPQSSKDPFPMSEARFQKRVFSLLAEMRSDIEELKRPVPIADSVLIDFQQASSVAEFETLEERLQDKEEFKVLRQKLAAVGGLNVKEEVKGCLTKLMTNELMSRFNMKGMNGKVAFGVTAVCKVVLSSVQLSRSAATEFELRQAVATCLKYAQDRRGAIGTSLGLFRTNTLGRSCRNRVCYRYKNRTFGVTPRRAEIHKRHLQLKETHQQRKQALDTRIQEAELTKQRLEEEEAQKWAEESHRQYEMLNNCVTARENLIKKLQTQYSSCKYIQLVSEAGKMSLSLLQRLVTNADQTRLACKESGQTTPDSIARVSKILEHAKNAYEFVKQEIDMAMSEGAKLEAEGKAKAEQAQAAAASTAAAQAAASTASTATAGQGAPGSVTEIVQSATEGGASLCVDIEAFKRYMILQEKLKAVEKTPQSLNTPEMKKLKFGIQKSINTAINAISSVSGSHLREKLERLTRLLSSQQVEVNGRPVSIQGNQEAVTFCKLLMGKMFVKKGDEQVSSNHVSAFAIAMVAMGLWSAHPDVGELILAHLQLLCPYVVPYYIPQQEGQSSEEYLKSRGYRFENGVVEKQDKFLKRMSGLMCLYSAMIVSSPPRGQDPYGVENAWIWLSRIMNITPEPDITATMIYDLLQVSGHALFATYRKQFQKLLYCLIKNFVPKLSEVASPAGAGVLSRLKLLLETSFKHGGNIPKPEGLLQPNFWMT